MEKIASFTVNHLKLNPGVYQSRQDYVGEEVITTFDLRMTAPNKEPVMNTAEIHTIEHLGATFLRNDEEFKDKTIYFGPMGCRTGFYLLTRNTAPEKVLEVTKKVLEQIVNHKGKVFGATRKECGNFRDLNLESAQKECKEYLKVLAFGMHDFKYKS